VLGGGSTLTTATGGFTSGFHTEMHPFPKADGTGWTVMFKVEGANLVLPFVKAVRAICALA
jgi:hypothetical protein